MYINYIGLLGRSFGVIRTKVKNMGEVAFGKERFEWEKGD